MKEMIPEKFDKKWEQVKYSYAAASLFPIKILLNNGLVKHIRENRKIPMVHVQLNPTNRCNRSCSFCSCSERNKSLELSHKKIVNIMREAKKYGCQSCTITGGGESLMHKKINEIIMDISGMGIEIGLVTNGDLLKKLTDESLKRMRWCRISLSDYGTFDEAFVYHIKENIERGPAVDWSFSYVLMRTPEFEKIARAIDFANKSNFSHVRIVSDLLDLEFVPDMEVVKKEMKARGVDDSIVNYQERKDFGLGDERCLISLLKPVIGADGYLYPCCLDENEPVVVERNEKLMNIPIKDVKIGDKCYGGRVILSMKRGKESSKMFEIVLNGGRSIRASEDHHMLIGKKLVLKNKPKIRHSKELESYELEDIEVKNLKIGDKMPVIIKTKNYEKGKLSNYMARILGYYIAEGHYSKNKKQIIFSFGKKEKWKEDLKECLRKEGIYYKVYIRRTEEQINTYSSKLIDIIEKNECGNLSTNKGVPTIIFNARSEIKKEFLKAYIRGDGYIQKPNKTYNGFRLLLSTVSRKLASDLTLLLSQLDVIARPKIERREGKMVIEGRTVNVHDIYRINIAGYYNLVKIKESLDVELYRGQKSQKRASAYPKKDNIMFIPIKEIIKFKPKGEIYDLTIVPNHTMVAGVGNILIRQCGTQYALKEPTMDYEKSMRMGKAENIGKLYESQSWFNGSVCAKCYYKDYNYLLNLLFTEIKHVRFV